MKYLLKSMQMARSTYYFELSKADQVAVRNHCLADEIKDIFSQHKGRYGVRRVDASYKIQRGIHVHLIQFFMCPEFWVHITSVAICFYLNQLRFKQNLNHVSIDCYI